MTSNGNDRSHIFVRVNPASFERRLNITGEIWLDVDGFAFPSQSWSDFPVIILSWWLDALQSVRSVGNAEFLFMDGPHLFDVVRDSGECSLRCLDHTADETQCVREIGINFDELCSQITNAARIIVRECRQRAWVTDDTAALESKLDALASQSA
jgi:hypothetical protein